MYSKFDRSFRTFTTEIYGPTKVAQFSPFSNMRCPLCQKATDDLYSPKSHLWGCYRCVISPLAPVEEEIPMPDFGRSWNMISSGAYNYIWASTKGDILIATFEKYPSLNGRALPVYGEDLEEILSVNPEDEIRKLLK